MAHELRPGVLVQAEDGRKGRIITLTRPKTDGMITKSAPVATVKLYQDGRPTGEYAEIPTGELTVKGAVHKDFEFLTTAGKQTPETDLDQRLGQLSHDDLFKAAQILFKDMPGFPNTIVGEGGRNTEKRAGIAPI